MIVECEKCSVRFQLDESRVPAEGIRVRCSRCKHSFFLRRPGASPAEEADALAQEALEPGAGTPASTEDLAAEENADDTREESANDGEESDWEFNDAVPGSNEFEADDDADPATDTVENDAVALASEDDGAGDSSLEVTSFGRVDDFSSLAEADAETGLGGAEASPSIGESAQTDAIDPLLEGGREELGEPENWDFFGDEDPPAPEAMSIAAPSDRPAESALHSSGPVLQAAALDTREEGPGLRALRSAGRAAGWFVALSLLALGLVRGLVPGFHPVTRPEPAVASAGWVARGVESHWVETARSGTLLSVTGELRNRDGGSLDRAGPWQAALLGPVGLPLELDSGRARLGVPLSEPALRELPPEALRGSLARAADKLATTSVERGGSLRFQAIFERVPAEAERLRVERAEARPFESFDPSLEAPEPTAVPVGVVEAISLQPFAAETP
ncbi:MAG: zinc-ribbon domain-containing protein [Proteobacteria bacterium]|nr:zinc-ribbon domain-containing protein [Pseudomonadota bacterium]